jgi:CelD/BcsL family acetyltransferase involved in cellulose biosynthesis
LDALYRTYGYKPVVYTTSAPNENLQDALLFCRVESWLTSRRLVSLPFSDHCDPLVNDADIGRKLLAEVGEQTRTSKWSYIEIRPRIAFRDAGPHFKAVEMYYLHELDLNPSLDTLFRNLHKDSVQRKIRRAEREGLRYEEGRSEELLENFYQLLLITRRRHRIPPQPGVWYRNLIDSFGDALKIRVAYKGPQPIAAIITLSFKATMMYKFGSSDAKFHNLGGMQLLLWKSILDAKECGLCTFDLGRSEAENAGLTTFKDRWGATRSESTYSRYFNGAYPPRLLEVNNRDWKFRILKPVFAHVPDRWLTFAGDLLYRHIG